MLREIGDAARAVEVGIASPPLWDALAGRLRAVDAEIEVARDRTPGRASALLAGWRPLGAAALAAASALALVLALRASAPAAPGESVGVGSLRFLDTGGVPVILMQESEDVTIIWLMDAASDEL